MPAEISFIEYGNIATSTATATTLNFGSTVTANMNPTTFPVTVGTYGMSKIFKLSFGGSFTSVSGIKIYITGGSYITGEVINIGTSTSFVAPTGGSNADGQATTAVPTTAPTTANVKIGGSATGTITDTENTTDYIYMQSSMSILASATAIPEKTLTVTFDET